MAYRDIAKRRSKDLARFHRRNEARRAAGLCLKCGKVPPAPERTLCEPCLEKRRANDRARSARLRAEGKPRRDLEKAREYERARSRREHAERRAQGRCVDCGVATAGAARCPACAYRSNSRAPGRHAAQAGPPFYTVIELETGIDRGTYETEAETAACLVFLGLRIDQVDIRSNMPLLAPALTGVP